MFITAVLLVIFGFGSIAGYLIGITEGLSVKEKLRNYINARI